MKDFSKLEKALKLKFKDKNLLTQAFVHRSYLNEHPNFKLNHNERLEFLGDAVLELVVTEHLFRKYERPEGDMTNWRAAIVNTQSLSESAEQLGFKEYLLLSQGEKRGSEKARQYILADAFEAFLGALYLDQGLKAAKDFIETHLISKLPLILKQGLYVDAKSRFQEKAQEKVKVTPIYEVLKEWGPDHNKHFLMGVFLDQELAGEGQGSSKREAEEQAARKALEAKGW